MYSTVVVTHVHNDTYIFSKGKKGKTGGWLAAVAGRATAERSEQTQCSLSLAGRGGSAGSHSIAWVMIGTPVAGGQPVRLL